MARLRAIGRRPTLWVELTLAAAWAAILAGAGLAHGEGAGTSATGVAGGPLWICTTALGKIGAHSGHAAAIGSPDSAALFAATPMWGLMALAMMVPTAMPAVRHVAGTSLYWRRRRAAAEFLAIFVGLWTAFAALVLTPLASWEAVGSPFALAVALMAAALWQLTPLKHRALLACHRSRPLPPRGWRASAGVANFSLCNSGACIASCWAMMTAAAMAGPGRLLWMGAMTGVMAVEKLAERPRRATHRVAALLASAAVGVALAALLD